MNVSSWLNATSVDHLDKELILAHILGVERTFLHAHPDRELTEAEQGAADDLARRRANHEPLAYLIGTKEFYGRSFKVTPDTLIPRPETEAIIDTVKTLHPSTILDVGTGSGCIAITLALELPDSQIDAVDISKEALKIAQENAQNLGAKVNFYESDLLENTQSYQIIVANLPYVGKNWDWTSPELAFEPASALYAEDEGLALIKKLISQAPAHLAPSGYLILEADRSQHQKISSYARDFDFVTISDAQSSSEALTLVLQLSSHR